MLKKLRTYLFLSRRYRNLPDGWLSRYQAEELYETGYEQPGPFLEIGPWIGRSTCCIANGIQDSGQSKTFVSVDLGLCSEEEWHAFFGKPLSDKPNKEAYLPHITRPGGTIASLEENLKARKLDRLVDVRKGDFRNMTFPEAPFQTIFCDASHNVREVRANLPIIADLLAPGGILVADDIANADILRTLLEHFPCSRHRLRERLFIGVKEG